MGKKIIDGKLQCCICGLFLPVNNFFRSKATRSGYRSHCKVCQRKKWGAASTVSTFDKRFFGGLRSKVLERDGYKCVECGLTNEEHISKWNRSITIDHIDGQGHGSKTPNNKIDNLQTLCLTCHGKKDYEIGLIAKHNKRLTDGAIEKLRNLWKTTNMSVPQLAKKFGICNWTVRAKTIGISRDFYVPHHIVLKSKLNGRFVSPAAFLKGKEGK